MNRLLALLSLVAFSAVGVFAQMPGTSISRVEFCKVTNDSGTVSYSKGAPIPITIQPIQSNLSNRGVSTNRGSRFGSSPVNGGPKNFGVFKNNMGDNFVAEEGPSVIDDLVLTSAGNGKAWRIVKFAVHLSTSSRTGRFLVRWRGFDTFTSGLGPGNMAFSGEMFDFGFYLQRSAFPAGDTFLVTADLSLNPLGIVDDQVCFLAQQFREPQLPIEQGEGQFTSTWNVFANNGPQIGSSEDLFWYDAEPDGIYDETEADQFDPEQGGAGAGNFLFDVEVGGGTTNVVNPISYVWQPGVYQSGTVGSLWFSDNNYNVAKAGIVPFLTMPPAQITVESFSPTSTPVGLRIDVEAKVNTVNLGMRVEMWNFQTSQWVPVVSGPVAMTDTTLIGFAAFPDEFVQLSSGLVRAKVSFYNTGPTPFLVWTASVDRIVWTITAP